MFNRGLPPEEIKKAQEHLRDATRRVREIRRKQREVEKDQVEVEAAVDRAWRILNQAQVQPPQPPAQ